MLSCFLEPYAVSSKARQYDLIPNEKQMIYIVFTIMIIVVAADGGFRHAYYLTSRQISYALKLNYIAQSIFTVGEACGKSSIAFLLLRIMGVTAAWRKWVMWILIVLTLSISIATLFMTFFQCQNPKALWDEELAKTTSCWAPNVETGWALFVSSKCSSSLPCYENKMADLLYSSMVHSRRLRPCDFPNHLHLHTPDVSEKEDRPLCTSRTRDAVIPLRPYLLSRYIRVHMTDLMIAALEYSPPSKPTKLSPFRNAQTALTQATISTPTPGLHLPPSPAFLPTSPQE